MIKEFLPYDTVRNDALKIADTAYLFDNSAGEPNMFAVKKHGEVVIMSDYIPKWFKTYFIDVLG